MRELTRPWPAGTPTWVDLSADDPEAAAASYAELLGWKCVRPDTREYWLCSVDGQEVGGIGAKRPGGLPSRWTTYLATDQLDRTLDLVVAHGGRMVVRPSDIEQHGLMAIVADPDGAIFGLWEAAEHVGTDRRTDPGSLVWSEALSRDFEAAKAFYVAVFGYEAEEIGGDGPRYAALYAGGRPVAGIAELHPDLPAGALSPQWLPIFATTGADAAVAQVRAGGGGVVCEPFDTDFGRMTILRDAESAPFSVIHLG
ncbi:VOC family protein [Kribbella sp. NPDC049174]|uniref:VOC family protein n=1 Tax=Kribbella sp. NPDC049174 TaxID=3364112 RepID=UPI00370FDA3E